MERDLLEEAEAHRRENPPTSRSTSDVPLRQTKVRALEVFGVRMLERPLERLDHFRRKVGSRDTYAIVDGDGKRALLELCRPARAHAISLFDFPRATRSSQPVRARQRTSP